MDQKEYYNNIGYGNIHVRHESMKYTSDWLEKRLLQFSDIRRGMLVLDAGCGKGKLTEGIKNCRIIGTDISYGEILHTGMKERLTADVTMLPFGSSKFDRVISMEVVEHLSTKDHVKKALREMHRVLRTGGLLSLSTPNRDNFVFFFNHVLRGKRNPNPTLHPTMLSRKMLETMIKDAGFRILKFETYLFPVPIPKYEYRLSKKPMKFLHQIGKLPGFGSVAMGFVVKAEKI